MIICLSIYWFSLERSFAITKMRLSVHPHVCVCVRICSCACAPTPTMSHGTVYVCLWWTGFKEVWRPDWLLVGWLAGCWLNIRMYICWVFSCLLALPHAGDYSLQCTLLWIGSVMKIFSSSLVYYKEGRCGLPLAFSRWLPTWKQHNCILI